MEIKNYRYTAMLYVPQFLQSLEDHKWQTQQLPGHDLSGADRWMAYAEFASGRAAGCWAGVTWANPQVRMGKSIAQRAAKNPGSDLQRSKCETMINTDSGGECSRFGSCN